VPGGVDREDQPEVVATGGIVRGAARFGGAIPGPEPPILVVAARPVVVHDEPVPGMLVSAIVVSGAESSPRRESTPNLDNEGRPTIGAHYGQSRWDREAARHLATSTRLGKLRSSGIVKEPS
jgi:hypothetical protein